MPRGTVDLSKGNVGKVSFRADGKSDLYYADSEDELFSRDEDDNRTYGHTVFGDEGDVQYERDNAENVSVNDHRPSN